MGEVRGGAPGRYGRSVRRLLITAALAVAASGAFAVPAGASCNDVVRWHGTTYAAVAAPKPPAPGRALRGGVRTGCRDVVVDAPDGAAADAADVPVRLRALRGVDPALAVRLGAMLYLAPGFLPQLASNPLHRLFPGRHGRRCAGTRHLTGAVAGPVGPTLWIVTPTGPVEILVQRDTRVRAPHRAGQPHLATGDRIAVTGRSCAGPALEAASIRRAG